MMIQCVVCEDWYHGRHLARDPSASVCPSEELYEEMICYSCVEKFDFLKCYMGLAVSLGTESDSNNAQIRVNCGDSDGPPVIPDGGSDGPLVIPDGGSDRPPVIPDGGCKLRPVSKETEATTLFFPGKWRKNLCRCPKCIEMYSARNIAFLADEEDTVVYYESRAKEQKKGTLEHGMEALSKMDRVKQVEAIHSYNNMKDNLMEYLAKFANNKKVVREEDIREFFQGITSNKKKKYDGAPPSSCK